MTDVWTTASVSAGRYDAWLCDIWGVLHNGAVAYQSAVDACAAFRRQGGRVILISNAARPAPAVATQLAAMGITDASYDAIQTSGDLTRALLQRMEPRPLFLIGPIERHRSLIEGLANPLVGEDEAQMILCSALFERDENEQPEDYRPLLQRLAERNLRMLCANPDLAAQSGDKVVPCAGALAAIYRQLGGSVIYAGKPHPEVYAEVRTRLAAMTGHTIPDNRILAIGDGVETDIRGAANAGIDALYIASPVHLHEPFSQEAVTRLLHAHGVPAVAAMPALAW